jgi:hypothetical protein
MSDQVPDDSYDEGFDLVPAALQPPEGDIALALQEQAAATDAIVPDSPAPPVVGRTWALDPEAGRLLPPGAPVGINGVAAMRQAVEKVLRTSRGSSPVQGMDYGLDGADRQAEGQPFDHAAFADAEVRTRDALLGSLPWVLDVVNFDAFGDQASTQAFVSFQVVPEGDYEPITIDRFPLPST